MRYPRFDLLKYWWRHFQFLYRRRSWSKESPQTIDLSQIADIGCGKCRNRKEFEQVETGITVISSISRQTSLVSRCESQGRDSQRFFKKSSAKRCSPITFYSEHPDSFSGFLGTPPTVKRVAQPSSRPPILIKPTHRMAFALDALIDHYCEARRRADLLQSRRWQVKIVYSLQIAR